MGLIVSIVIIALFCGYALAGKPKNVVYALLAVTVCFSELGTGFTSFTASIFFNQAFLNLFNFKLIELLIAATYIIFLITSPASSRNRNFLSYNKKLLITLVALITIISFIGYWKHHSIAIGGWRLIIPGVMFMHMMYMALDTEEKILEFSKVFVFLLAARSLLGLAMYAVGHGIDSPRGNVPFFWDSRQVGAFSMGIIFMTAYLSQYKSLPIDKNRIAKWLAIAMLIVLILTVLLSIRRTLWAIAIFGSGMVLLTSRRVGIPQYAMIAGAVFLSIVVVMTVPAFEKTKNKLHGYIASVNLFNTEVAGQIDNRVHINNVEEYSRIILSDSAIILFGFQGRDGASYASFQAEFGNEFNLGQAHNGILRTTLIFGAGGLLIYLAFYLHLLFNFRKIQKIPDDSHWQWISKGGFYFVIFQFGSELTFVPPFYTSFKGLIYTLIPTFLVYSALFYSSRAQSTMPEETAVNDDNDESTKSSVILKNTGNRILGNKSSQLK